MPKLTLPRLIALIVISTSLNYVKDIFVLKYTLAASKKSSDAMLKDMFGDDTDVAEDPFNLVKTDLN